MTALRCRLPASWDRMTFFNRMCYLVNVHAVKNFSEARAVLTVKRPTRKPPLVEVGQLRLPYADN